MALCSKTLFRPVRVSHSSSYRVRPARRSMGIMASSEQKEAYRQTDLTGKVIVMTGSNSGIGYEAAKDFTKRNAHVIIATRSAERGQKAADQLSLEAGRDRSQGKAEFMQLDLSSFRSVKEFSDRFLARKLPLSMLVNDASLFIPKDETTEDGFEITLQTNYFSHFYLTQLLLPKLKDNRPARVVWVASGTEASAPQKIDYNNLTGKGFRSDYRSYATSKEWVIMATKEWQRRLEGSGVNIYVVQPGLARTKIFSKMDFTKPSAWVMELGQLVYGQPADRGAIPIIYAATAPEEELTGKGGGTVYGPPYQRIWPGIPSVLQFFKPINRHQGTPENPFIYDDNECKRLFEATERLLEQKVPQPAKA